MKKCIFAHISLREPVEGFIKEGKAYFEDKKGNLCLPAEDRLLVYECDNGLIEVKVGRKWGYANIHTGEIVIPPQWDWVSSFYGEYAHVANRYRNGRHSRTHEHGVINTKGKCVIPLKYADCSRITIWPENREREREKTFFIMKKGSLYGVINEKNEVVIPFEYNGIKYDSDSKKLICKKRRRYGVLDLEGKIIVPFEYTVYDYEWKSNKYRFGVMKKGTQKVLKAEARLLRAVFGINDAPDEEDYTYFAEKWMDFYDKDFNKIDSEPMSE